MEAQALQQPLPPDFSVLRCASAMAFVAQRPLWQEALLHPTTRAETRLAA
jgi:hypothetical protein